MIGPPQLLVAVAALALLVAAVSLLLSTSPPGDPVDASTASSIVGAQASTPETEAVSMPVLRVDVPGAEGTYVVPEPETAPTAVVAPSTKQPAAAPAPATTAAAPAADAPSTEQPAAEAAPAAVSPSTEQSEPAAAPDPAPAPAPSPDPDRAPAPTPGEPALGSIKSKADDKGYDVHGHVEHSVALLGQQVLIPGQAATGGLVQKDAKNYVAYSPVTAMLPVAIQDNKEVLEEQPNLKGEKLYRRLAQEYTGSNDYENLDRDAQRAINILTCTDWSLVKKSVRENTINHLLHSPISFGTIGSVANPISTDVTIDLGYTHTRDENWTEVEYMGNNVYKITVVSNNNNGSHTGHAMGTAYVEMPAGTTLKEAQKIGNRMIPSTNKNNKLTIDPAARALFDSMPRGASPMILFEHLSEEEQNAYFEGRGIETVGKPSPDCNPLEGSGLGSTPAPAEAPAEEPEAPAEDQAPQAGEAPAEAPAPAEEPEAPAGDQAPAAEGTSAETPAEAPAEEPEPAPADGPEPAAEPEAAPTPLVVETETPPEPSSG
jgi:hypothetical protein